LGDVELGRRDGDVSPLRDPQEVFELPEVHDAHRALRCLDFYLYYW
jgi:hypothetical protein